MGKTKTRLDDTFYLENDGKIGHIVTTHYDDGSIEHEAWGRHTQGKKQSKGRIYRNFKTARKKLLSWMGISAI